MHPMDYKGADCVNGDEVMDRERSMGTKTGSIMIMDHGGRTARGYHITGVVKETDISIKFDYQIYLKRGRDGRDLLMEESITISENYLKQYNVFKTIVQETSKIIYHIWILIYLFYQDATVY